METILAMSWLGTDAGVWRRDLGGLEKVYWRFSRSFESTGQEHLGLYAICTLAFDSDFGTEQCLKATWKSLCLEYPGLTVTSEGSEATYRALTPYNLDRWTEHTFVIEKNKTTSEFVAWYPLRNLPALVYFPATSELMLLASHWRVDATGCCFLLNRLLELISSAPSPTRPPYDQSLARLSPALEDAASAPYGTDPQIEATAAQVTGAAQRKARESIGLAYKGHLATPPSVSAAKCMTFTAESSRVLREACRKNNLSVSATAFVALGLSVLTLAEGGESKREFSAPVDVSMRPYLKTPFDTPAHACQAYVSTVTPTIALNRSFLENAREVTRYLRTWHTEDYNRALRDINQTTADALAKRASKPSTPGPWSNPPSGVSMSSLGVVNRVIAKEYGEFVGVKAFRLGASILTRQMLLHLWTFNDQIHLSVSYNRAYYDEATPRRLLEQLRGWWEREMHLELRIADV